MLAGVQTAIASIIGKSDRTVEHLNLPMMLVMVILISNESSVMVDLKKYVADAEWVHVIDFYHVPGDTIKEKINAVLVKLIELSGMIGGHDECAVVFDESNNRLLLESRPWGFSWYGKDREPDFDSENDVVLEGMKPDYCLRITEQQCYSTQGVVETNEYLLIREGRSAILRVKNLIV